MSARGYSLVEVVVAAAIVAIGVAAGAAIMNTLVVQEEMNSGAVRAANLQEQSVMLYRLGITNPQDLYNILPESCSASTPPGSGAFALTFGAAAATNFNATLSAGGQTTVACQVVTCSVVYGSPIAGSGQVSYLSNSLSFVRPTIRVGP
jgi:prepilin-type N-terminal cleavage/methylation domain-containing protein